MFLYRLSPGTILSSVRTSSRIFCGVGTVRVSLHCIILTSPFVGYRYGDRQCTSFSERTPPQKCQRWFSWHTWLMSFQKQHYNSQASSCHIGKFCTLGSWRDSSVGTSNVYAAHLSSELFIDCVHSFVLWKLENNILCVDWLFATETLFRLLE